MRDACAADDLCSGYRQKFRVFFREAYYRQGLHHPLSLTLAHATPRGPADQAEAAVATQLAPVENPVKTRV